ncbi:MAG TPA: serine/threonine-protein kinase, partial [Terriglobales bacterium]
MAEQTPALKEDLTGAQIGRYRVVRRLGRGGMGEVYLAEDPRLKREVAIKRMGARLRSEERQHQRFLKEAERVSRLNHPHIAAIYDIVDCSGETFLVMEYIDGKMLRSHIPDPLNLRQVLQMAVECADALQAAHHAGVVHRDIKPENIMLTSTGSAKILDFGLAKRMPSASANRTDESFSGSGTMSGTFAYMAPEALREERLDGRADIFSLGIVVYECLTGQHPFIADTFIETTQRILEQTPAPVSERNPDLPSEVNDVLMKMLAKEPAHRHQSAAELLADLLTLEKKLQ